MSEAGERLAGRLKDSRGFTLFEVLVIVAILSLLTGIIYPSVDKAMRRQSFVEAANRFDSALHAARARAIRTGIGVRFGISADQRGFGERGSPDRLPDGVTARSAHDGGIDFFADGTASGGNVMVRDGRWERLWRVHPTTGAIERIR